MNIPPQRATRALLCAALLCLSGCVASGAPPVEPPPPPPSSSGLRPVSSSPVDFAASYAGHSRELVLDGDLIFVADANGLPILRADADGALELLHGVEPERFAHCSTLALHAPSRTLLCAATDGGPQALIDVRDPEAPVARPWPQPDPAFPYYALPDIAIDGDDAWLAADDSGLVHAPIGPDGTPGDFEVVGDSRAVEQVVVTGGRVVYLDRLEGLVVLDQTTRERLGVAPLAGPPIDLQADGDRLVVSLGSEGVQIFTLDPSGRPEPGALVQPRCVATGADLEGDALAVSCLSGVTLYDLSGETPRPAGFVPSRFGMLDVAFTPYGLLVADWYVLDVLSTHLDGTPSVPDAPRVLRMVPGADARVPLRNPGDVALEVSWALVEGRARRETGALTLGPGEQSILVLPYGSLAAAGSTSNMADLVVQSPAGDLEARTRLWHRGADEEPARGVVAIGDAFPVLRRTSPSPAPDTLPSAGAPTLVMFLTVDCYLQWPQLEDMAWSSHHGTGQPSPTIFFLTPSDEDPFDPSHFMRRFDALDLLTVEWADYVGSVPGTDVEPSPVRAFERSFMMRAPGADFPHDYAIDAGGIATTTSRLFRGRWPLGE